MNMIQGRFDAPVYFADRVRAGETGHHVRYVLGLGMAGSIAAMIAVAAFHSMA